MKIDKDVVESDSSSREEGKVVQLLDLQDNPYQTGTNSEDKNTDDPRTQGDSSRVLINDNDLITD